MHCLDLNYIAYVGTYTEGKSEGIYSFKIEIESGKLAPLEAVNKLPNPSYIITDKNCEYLYAVIETSEFNGEPGGAVAAYSIDKKTGCLRFINSQSTKGSSPCHLCIDSNRKYLLAANYSSGTISVFPLANDGRIEPLSSIAAHQGSGPNPNRQEGPHAHYVTFMKDENLVCAVDLGIDKIVVYNFDYISGCLTPCEALTFNVSPGSGPRHLHFHPNGSFVYLINELNSDVIIFNCSNPKSQWKQIQCISALPDGYTEESYCAAIHISPDGKFLYASNRGHDSIACFRIDAVTGMLSLISHTSTKGFYPRDFSIDPTGKFLFAANQKSGTIVTFKICNTGELEQSPYFVQLESPVCIKTVCIHVR